MPGECRIAIIGAGYMAAEHIKAFRAIPGVTVAGIHSRTLARAETLAKDLGVGATCRTVDELFERARPHLVVIAVPELSVRSVSEACFAYRVPCLIEKPAGYDLPDAEAIAAAAKSSATPAYVALNRRHYSSTRAVLRELETCPGSRFISALDQEDPAGALAAGQPQTVIDNWMFANSIHVIDYLMLFGRGPVVGVDAFFPYTPGTYGIVAANIRFASGDLGLYQAVWGGPGPWAVSVTTSQKRWEMRPLEQAAVQPAGQRRMEPMELDSWDQEFKPGLRRQAQLAVAAANGESPAELPTVYDALASMRLAAVIYQRTPAESLLPIRNGRAY